MRGVFIWSGSIVLGPRDVILSGWRSQHSESGCLLITCSGFSFFLHSLHDPAGFFVRRQTPPKVGHLTGPLPFGFSFICPTVCLFCCVESLLTYDIESWVLRAVAWVSCKTFGRRADVSKCNLFATCLRHSSWNFWSPVVNNTYNTLDCSGVRSWYPATSLYFLTWFS